MEIGAVVTMLIKRLTFFMVIISIYLAGVGCGSTNSPAEEPPASANIFSLPKNDEGYTDISVEQLEAALANKDFSLINVHIPYEGELPQTDAFVPFNEIEANLSQLPADKDAPIVLYCRSGRMSTDAAEELVELGYTNIVEVDGGMQAWEAAGNELISK
jgi:rhodanese-related sulfurtransferase